MKNGTGERPFPAVLRVQPCLGRLSANDQTLSCCEVSATVFPVRLLHLAWGPLGLASLASFLDLYQSVSAGVDHEFSVILNGFSAAEAADAEDMVRRVGSTVWATPAAMQDLDAYREAADALPADAYCFVNSYSRPLADGWLAKLVAAAGADGLAGATGSYETQRIPFPPAAPNPRRSREYLTTLATHAGPAVRSRVTFPPFPNAHLRTNAFAMSGRTFRAMRWAPAPDKRAALAIEGGRRSLSKQATRMVLVDVDGNAVPPDHWPDARIFRSGEQERLLVADNRTDQYAKAGLNERRQLRELAWGAER